MQKTLLRIFTAALLVLTAFTKVNAQCANDNALVAGSLTPPGVSQSTTVSYSANTYVLAYVVTGANYTLATCGGTWDTQITVYDDATGTFIAYNDDFCGLQSTVSFTATTCGFVRVLLDQWPCSATSSLAGSVTMTMNSAGAGAPTLTAAPDETECNGNGTSIGLNGNGSGGQPPYSYSWLPITNLLTPNQASTAVTTVTTTVTYTLTITDANGCSATDQVVVSVLPAPVVNLGADDTICSTSVTLDAGNPGSSYLWSTGAGTQQVVINQSGTYSVVVQNSSGCLGGDNITITLNTPPSYSLSDTTSCGNSVVLDAGSGYTSYQWSTGATTQTVTVTGTDTLAVTVTDAGGCVLSDSVVVTLSPSPVVNLGSDTTQCGGTVTLDAGNPGSLYFWSNSTSGQTTTVSSSGTYAVNVLTQAGCSSTDTIVVTINNQPLVNLGPDTSICLSAVLLDAGNPGSTYSWSTGSTNQSITVGSGTYWVTATDPSGCADSDTIQVTTNQPANVTASQDTAICAGGQATLSATGGVTYLWSTNATGSTTTVSPTTSTAYYVTGTDINGCQASDVVLVTILPSSNAQFTSTQSGATVTFTNQSTNASSYSWNFGDNSPISNSANPSHTYTQNGVYTVTLTVTGPCGTDTYTQVVTITQVGMEESMFGGTLNIYPNPATEQFTVQFSFTGRRDVEVELLDVTGRVMNQDKQSGVEQYRREYSTEGMSGGMYFIRITTAEGTVTRKITVQ